MLHQFLTPQIMALTDQTVWQTITIMEALMKGILDMIFLYIEYIEQNY